MREITLRNSRKISESEKPYIVAEVNTSHFGDLEVAKRMIDAVKEAGCDCVKFQSWSESSINSKTFYDENPIAKRFFKKFSLSESGLKEVAMYSKEVGIDFSSTPYSTSEVDYLINECNAPFIKVASMDLTNYKYLDYIGRTGVPIILSTGMGEMDEIRKAVATIEKTGNKNLCILHCVSIYPPELSTVRLKNILGLQKEFPNYPIGYSDHTIGIEVPTAAIALGACVIEKHFTLDKAKIGMDNQVACEAQDMKEMVDGCRNVHVALGDERRTIFEDEIKQRMKMRRSLVYSKDLVAGAVLTEQDMESKRPGTGFAPELLASMVGKVLTRDVVGDTIIKAEDLK